MATEIDSLQININAQATKANRAVDALVGKLDRLNTSLSKVNGTSIIGLANGVDRLGRAMQTMNTIKTADFTRLANNLQKMGNINVASINSAASSMSHLTRAFNSLGSVSANAQRLTDLANSIRQLGYKSTEKAIANIPRLTTALSGMMTTLSKSPTVSKNIIKMTNALANLSAQGSKVGTASNAIVNGFDKTYRSAVRTRKGFNGLAGAIGKFYATYWLLIRAFRGLGKAINISSSLTEVQNVVDVTFGKYKNLVNEMSETSIAMYGMSELTVKQVSSRFQAMGTAMGFAQGRMADMSVELTKLTADMASFYNVSQEDVAKDLESIFTGQTRPMRTYGIDLTQATLQEWALNQGMEANMKTMTQAEKTMLRYQYVMAHTGQAQGDFLRTQDTWANQTRILKQNIQQLASVVGGTLINSLKPLVKALNVVILQMTKFAEIISNALGKIFGWTYEDTSGGVTSDFEDALDVSEDLEGSTGGIADNIKKIQKGLRGFDELKIINLQGKDKNSGSGVSSAGGASDAGQWTQTDSMIKQFESEIDSLYELGQTIGNALKNAMNNIKWQDVYEKAQNFGKGLAQFLNGLFEGKKGETLFGKIGKTIAGALNTVIYSALSFGKEFDFEQFGLNIADGINEFFEEFDFKALAETINTWVQGIYNSLTTAIKEIDWKEVWNSFVDLISELDLKTVEILVGAFALKWSGKLLTTALINKVISSKLLALKAVGSLTLPKIAISVGQFALATGSGGAFTKIASDIVTGIDENITKITKGTWGEKVLRILGEALAGVSLGGVSGSAIPGVGTVAGAIVGGVSGALKGIVDQSELLTKFAEAVFNFDEAKAFWNKAKESISSAFSSESFFEVGKYLVQAIFNGAIGTLGLVLEPLTDGFKELFKKIINGSEDTQKSYKTLEQYGRTSTANLSKAMENYANNSKTSFNSVKTDISGNQGDYNSLDKTVDGATNSMNANLLGYANSSKTNMGNSKRAIDITSTSMTDFANNTQKTTSGAIKNISSFDSQTKPKFTSVQTNSNNTSTALDNTTTSTKNLFAQSGKTFEVKTNVSALEKLKEFLDGLLGKLKSLFDYNGKTVTVGTSGFSGATKQFASGGFPTTGQLFVAREAGPELVGKIGNKTAVANNDQITNAISNAVFRAVTSAMSGAQSNVTFRVEGDPNGLFNVIMDKANEYTNRTGNPAFI